MDQTSESVNAAYHRQTKQYRGKGKKPSKPKDNVNTHTSRWTPKAPSSTPHTQCYLCGGSYPHTGTCPAKGAICNHCGKVNHFAKVCCSKNKNETASHKLEHRQVSEVHTTAKGQQVSNSDDEYVFTIASIMQPASRSVEHDDRPQVEVAINGDPVSVLVDTGSTANIIDSNTYDKLVRQPVLRKASHVQVYPYASDKPIPIRGRFTAEVRHRSNTVSAEFFVVSATGSAIINYKTAKALDLVQVCAQINKVESMITEFGELFQRDGKLKDYQLKLHIDESVPGSTQPHRRVPFHTRKKIKAELEKLMERDIIERVQNEPTPWISPLHVVPKPNTPGEIRVCVDMREANQAVQRERHLTPTVDELITEFNGSKVFTRLDMNVGYHHIELAPESRHITTFSTHLGIFRYKRLNFGISSAAEIFQDIIRQTICDLNGVINMSDDILVHGEDQAEHDKNLRAVLTRLRDKGLSLNRNKCEFNKKKVAFYGYVFSSDGISPDPRKVHDIKEAPKPESPDEVSSLLGLVNYCSRFIHNLATITRPLRDLTKKSIPWKWESKHEEAFNKLKQSIMSDQIMAYYDPKKETELLVDASPVGLGAILAQVDAKGQTIVAYASRSLTPTEQRYSQTEREALAITWACLHFHLYVFGSRFTVLTDHKPLVPIFSKRTSTPPARIEKWLMRLQMYDMTIQYRPGSDNPADYMSRHPCTTSGTSSKEESMAEE